MNARIWNLGKEKNKERRKYLYRGNVEKYCF